MHIYKRLIGKCQCGAKYITETLVTHDDFNVEAEWVGGSIAPEHVHYVEGFGARIPDEFRDRIEDWVEDLKKTWHGVEQVSHIDGEPPHDRFRNEVK